MQDVNHQLDTGSVSEVLSISMALENAEEIKSRLKQFNLSECQECHPMSLSARQKQRATIVTAIVSNRS